MVRRGVCRPVNICKRNNMRIHEHDDDDGDNGDGDDDDGCDMHGHFPVHWRCGDGAMNALAPAHSHKTGTHTPNSVCFFFIFNVMAPAASLACV